MKNSPFFPQAALLIRCLPNIAEESCFAMKGGTAINMFVRPMPRLSVDIDLTYIPIEDRETSLRNISAALERIAIKIKKTIPVSKVQKTLRSDQIIKLVVSTTEAAIKIEPNEVLRGTTTPPKTMDLVKEAEDLFEMSAQIPIVPVADLYGGKICAALDRQHPRDLFDIKILLDNEGITDEIRKGFLVYLCSHDRPMHEVFSPNFKDLKKIYTKEFAEMTVNPVPLEDLYAARETLAREIRKTISNDEKNFLLSLKKGQPQWDLLGLQGLDRLPALQWKLQNILRMGPDRRNEQIAKLEAVLL